MKRKARISIWIGALFLSCVLGTGFYLNRGLSVPIVPAKFNCLSLEDGYFRPIDTLPGRIYGIGLSYAGHINETAAEFNPKLDPPVFTKDVSSIMFDGGKVIIPGQNELLTAIEAIEPGLGDKLAVNVKSMSALLDYEVELGFVLLEDIDTADLSSEDYIPKIGFFIANDLSSRSLIILGEGQKNRYDYWGVGKSFPGFTPVASNVWVPNDFIPDAIPCVSLQCRLNGEVRQDQFTTDLIYTPAQMLNFIQRRYPNIPLRKGDWVLTGTPGGVILSTPRWVVRLANVLKINRFQKLKFKNSKNKIDQFIQPGDIMEFSGNGLGQVRIEFESN